MRDITLLSLSMENFKGQDYLSLEFNGQNATIYGDNAAGKTTIYDALTWLLFGKDSKGQSAFDIKPLDELGRVKDHANVTSIEAIFGTSDGPKALRKTFYEKWSTKRGQAEKTFDGNTSEYYVDGVPCKKYEFERQVEQMVVEDIFRLLTGVTYFCADMSWQDRRQVLFDVCGVATDGEIMASSPRFVPLAAAMGRLNLGDFKKKLNAERRGLASARDSVPARLDEHKKMARELEDIDFNALQAERVQRDKRRTALEGELLKLEHNALLDSKLNDRAALKNQLDKLNNDNAAFRATQAIPAGDNGDSLRREVADLKKRFLRWTTGKADADAEGVRNESMVSDCREQWKEVNAETFAEATCPTCGQGLTGAKLEEARERFERKKASRLQNLIEMADVYKKRTADSRARREECIGNAVEIEKKIAEVVAELANVTPVEQPQIVDMQDYTEKNNALLMQIAEIGKTISSLQGESVTIRENTKAAIAALSDEIQAIDGEISKKAMLDYTKERMEALRTEAKAAAKKLEELDKMLFLCEEFTRYKVQFVEDSINSKFRLVKFRLFTEQVNGGLADCCDATVDGVPYTSLNNGSRINVGMDVIATLSAHYGIRVPLFVDNAESVTELMDIDAQVIRLVVSGRDKKLRCDYGA